MFWRGRQNQHARARALPYASAVWRGFTKKQTMPPIKRRPVKTSDLGAQIAGTIAPASINSAAIFPRPCRAESSPAALGADCLLITLRPTRLG